jgi:hypothetical protein
MVQSSFTGIHSKEPSKDATMGDKIEPILPNRRSKHKPLSPIKNPKHKPLSPKKNPKHKTLSPTPGPTQNELDYQVAPDASNLSDPVKSESEDIYAISELHDSENDERFDSENDDSESESDDSESESENENEANGVVDTRHDQGRENAQAYRLRTMSPDLRRKRA